MKKEYSTKYLQINRKRGVIFDSSETPFTTIRPDLSDLGTSSGLAEQLRARFPALTFSQACIADGAVIIQDISPLEKLTQKAKLLNSSSGITLQVVDGFTLANNLGDLLTNSQRPTINTTRIFPGEGARAMFKISGMQSNENTYFLQTQRIMRGPGSFYLSVDYPTLPTQMEEAIIYDDVVATGQTASTIAKELKRRYPGIKCKVATWIMVEPRNSFLSGIEDVDFVFASSVVRGNYVRQPPINSLSCFVRSTRKYEAIKNNFLQKYIKDANLFNATLQELRGEI
ncbi:MAG: phosphoribosyltransferase [Candidatus Levybacteria bacterium]|nr:phosphoribosyltransferase [Candidatus Levybacteria bacterium]